MPAQTATNPLSNHITTTYFYQRIGVGIFTLIFPVVLIWLGIEYYPNEHPNSLSEHYHLGGIARDYFVATLAGVGTFLILYQGFDDTEEWLLNFAGLCALGVAFIPTGTAIVDQYCLDNGKPFTISLHALSAIGLFLSLGWITIRHINTNLGFLGAATRDRPPIFGMSVKGWFTAIYYVLGSAMIILPLAAYVLTRNESDRITWVETAGIVVFAFYWLAKSGEYRLSHADSLRRDVGVARAVRQWKQKRQPAAKSTDDGIVVHYHSH